VKQFLSLIAEVFPLVNWLERLKLAVGPEPPNGGRPVLDTRSRPNIAAPLTQTATADELSTAEEENVDDLLTARPEASSSKHPLDKRNKPKKKDKSFAAKARHAALQEDKATKKQASVKKADDNKAAALAVLDEVEIADNMNSMEVKSDPMPILTDDEIPASLHPSDPVKGKGPVKPSLPSPPTVSVVAPDQESHPVRKISNDLAQGIPAAAARKKRSIREETPTAEENLAPSHKVHTKTKRPKITPVATETHAPVLSAKRTVSRTTTFYS